MTRKGFRAALLSASKDQIIKDMESAIVNGDDVDLECPLCHRCFAEKSSSDILKYGSPIRCPDCGVDVVRMKL